MEWIKSQGPVELVITSDPDLTVKLLSVGITTLVFMSPVYIREEFRPDSRKGVKSWQKIVEEIDSQNAAYKEDPRIWPIHQNVHKDVTPKLWSMLETKPGYVPSVGIPGAVNEDYLSRCWGSFK